MGSSLTIRLGVIGLSSGNGHPYSWSAICNGYDPEEMRDCGFPVIPEYLSQQDWPSARLPGVQVTHVCTQQPTLSRQIARAARIEHVVERPEQMLGAIDGILLARDDAGNHRKLAAPFLEAGLPVYVDKPVALSLSEYDELHALQRFPGQIFSCSALRYAHELRISDDERAEIGPLRLISASTPKFWDTYSVHLIDPLLAHMLPQEVGSPEVRSRLELKGAGTFLAVVWEDEEILVTLTALGACAKGPLAFRLQGENGWVEKVFTDTFSAFRAALADFVGWIGTAEDFTNPGLNRRVVEVVEMGRGRVTR